MPSDLRISPPQRSVLSVEMVPLPADVHPASYQATLIACHHMGMPIDPCHLPRAPYMKRYHPYYQVPVGNTQMYEELRAGKAEGESREETLDPMSEERELSEEEKRAIERAYRRRMRRVKSWAEDVYRSTRYADRSSRGGGQPGVRRR